MRERAENVSNLEKEFREIIVHNAKKNGVFWMRKKGLFVQN